RAVNAYLRPEDIVARPAASGQPPLQADDPQVLESVIEKVEFLGAYCLVRVRATGLEDQSLTAYLSPNFLAEMNLVVGSRMQLRILAERMRVFEA
ncbi:MAG: TOBE domain-containing protein, partial [Proteobacteria bacterium]|nr:TOBE domain-containing protein [Pseudomonadota bacterium]